MRIGIDYIATVGGGGNSVYTKNLVEALLHADQNIEYYLYVYWHDYLLGRRTVKKQKNVHWRPAYISALGLPVPQVIVDGFNSIAIRFWARMDQLDALHFTNPLNFVGGLKKTIVTIHDLSSFHSINWTKEGSQQFFRERTKEILASSSDIIAVSEYTKQDIIKIFGTTENKITVVYEAADAKQYYPDLDQQYLKTRFNLNSYILYAGQLQPRKNILNILSAYAGLNSELKEKYQLVLVGSAREQYYFRKITEAIARLGITSHVRVLGRVDDEALRKLYSGARVFVFPSLFEGFGLPVLEALQCGIPIITSNTTSLPEVAGDAGILVNPESANEIAQAMEKILTGDDYRTHLKGRALVQAQRFGWQKTAGETIGVYKKATTEHIWQ